MLQALLSGSASPLDLRVGAQFRGTITGAVHAALREAAETITRMPATYLTYLNSGPILPVSRGRQPRCPDAMVLDAGYLAGAERSRKLRFPFNARTAEELLQLLSGVNIGGARVE